jgi:thermostable 8-oxoguanine DNA glycosylase
MMISFDDLEKFLKELISELENNNEYSKSLLIQRALEFRYGLPSEFLREVRIDLIAILNNNINLSELTLHNLKLYKNLIDQGFDYVNN